MAAQLCLADSIGISPGTINISSVNRETSCRNFSLIGPAGEAFSGEIKWSNLDSSNIQDYILSSEPLGINASFPEHAVPGRHTLCISSERSGNYSGLLMYKLENSSYGIIARIEFRSSGKNIIRSLALSTGKVAEEIPAGLKVWAGTSAILAIAFVFLIVKTRRSRKPITGRLQNIFCTCL